MNEAQYREVEAALFADACVTPEEHRVGLPSTGTDVRMLTVGEGEPIVFLTGGPMAAATWAYVAAQLPDRRCILVERPGTGLSAPLAEVPGPDELRQYVARLTVDVLDAFAIERAAVVGSSFGGFSALCTAAAFRERVAGVVLAGCPAFVPGWQRPAFFNVLRMPIVGRLFTSIPPSMFGARMFLKQMGHAAALTDGRITPAMRQWTLSWQRDTDTMRNDVAMILRSAFDPSVELDDDELKRVTAPCLFVVGTRDPVGDARVVSDVARRMIDAEVEVWAEAGHLPWLDDAARFAANVANFVSRCGRVGEI